MQYAIIMDARVAYDLQPFASTEATRCHLGGFCVNRTANGRLWATACDGHRLASVHIADSIMDASRLPCDRPIIKLPPAILKACKPNGRSGLRSWLRVYEGGKGCDIVRAEDAAKASEILAQDAEASTLANVIVDGTFPEWMWIIPRGAFRPCTATFRAQDLAAFSKLGAGLVTVHTTGGAMAPAIVTVCGRPDALCVVMPQRNDAATDPRELLK